MELRHEPFNVLKNFNHEINRLFTQQTWPTTGGAVVGFYPEVDIEETAREYTVIANIPGVAAKDLDVYFSQGVLTIKGRTAAEQNSKEKNYICVERGTGYFSRSFALPNVSDQAKINAQHKNGILILVIPKTTTASRKIQIKG